MTKHTLCQFDDIEEQNSKGFEVQGHKLFAVKKDNLVYVYQNRCPHLGVELEWDEDVFLDQEGKLIQCSTHGALFLIEDGSCVSGPCAGDQLTAIPSRVENKTVFIELKLVENSITNE